MSGVFYMYKELVALRDQQDPVVEMWEEEGKSKWERGIKDNKVMCYRDSRVKGQDRDLGL